MKATFIVSLVVLILSVTAMIWMVISGRPTAEESRTPWTLEPSERVSGLTIPEFELTAHTGGTFGKEIFDDRVTIATFMFTTCPICDVMTDFQVNMARQLSGTDVRFLSVSVDPERDTLEQLNEFAKEKELDLDRWTLARGDIETVRAIVEDGLKFAVGERKPDTPPTEMAIEHPLKYFLIGPDGRLLEFYGYTDPADRAALVGHARQASVLLRERGED